MAMTDGTLLPYRLGRLTVRLLLRAGTFLAAGTFSVQEGVMPAALSRSSFSVLAIGGLALVASAMFAAHGAAAQGATGTITGRVLWGPCIRALPIPISPDGQAAPAAPETPDAQSPSIQRPVPVGGLPAGAVLVAVQNSSINARTDEAGRFPLSGVPAGQYLMVAAGPVANSVTAIAERPNVFVNGGQSVDMGTLSLGSQSSALTCRFLPGAAGSDTAPATPGEAPNPTNP
jgi:hypothetical protein